MAVSGPDNRSRLVPPGLKTWRVPGWVTPMLVGLFSVTGLMAIYYDAPGRFEFSCRPFGGWSVLYAGMAALYLLHVVLRHIRRPGWPDLFAVLLIMPLVLTIFMSRHFQCGEGMGYSLALNRDVVWFTADQTLRSIPVGWDLVFPRMSQIAPETLPGGLWWLVLGYRWFIFGLLGLMLFRFAMMLSPALAFWRRNDGEQ